MRIGEGLPGFEGQIGEGVETRPPIYPFYLEGSFMVCVGEGPCEEVAGVMQRPPDMFIEICLEEGLTVEEAIALLVQC